MEISVPLIMTVLQGLWRVKFVKIFLHSQWTSAMRYTRFIGDGDTNTFKTVFDAKPYGDGVDIEKN